MPTARMKKLCVDATDPALLGRFWANLLGLRWEPASSGEGGIYGDGPQCLIWFNQVPEPKTVPHRVRFEVVAHTLAELEDGGARPVPAEPGPGGRRADGTRALLADVEGGEFEASLAVDVPRSVRLRRVVVDSARPHAQARWWADVLGSTADTPEPGRGTVRDVAGVGHGWDFVAASEPKLVKNRIHWDVAVGEVGRLVHAGATILRGPGGDIAWTVLADPEGNEFCAFV
ncbi:MAG TPA: VOC family protein [Jiangellaceae bacterium]